VYLVHFPVLFLAKKLISAYYQTIWTTPVLQACVALACLFVALLLSALTHRFIESPFIHQRQQRPITA
jgi:peptidoglycan/LPS O-acetylase OafA/YrhL